MTSPSDIPIRHAAVSHDQLVVRIQRSVDDVWHAITRHTNEWWPSDFRVLGPDSVVCLELKAGGRLFEQNGPSELLWYTVQLLQPSHKLSLAGFCTPEFGGPFMTLLTLSLVASGEATELHVSDGIVGAVTASQVASLRKGWTALFDEGLRAWMESR